MAERSERSNVDEASPEAVRLWTKGALVYEVSGEGNFARASLGQEQTQISGPRPPWRKLMLERRHEWRHIIPLHR